MSACFINIKKNIWILGLGFIFIGAGFILLNIFSELAFQSSNNFCNPFQISGVRLLLVNIPILSFFFEDEINLNSFMLIPLTSYPINSIKLNTNKTCGGKAKTSFMSSRVSLANATNSPDSGLHPYYITGFSDAESCFFINVRPRPLRKKGYAVEILFRINLSSKDKLLLEKIKDYFGVGRLLLQGNFASYNVRSLSDLQVIIDHFDRYPLISSKYSDYILFRQVFELIKQGQHLNDVGLKKIVSIKAVSNNGLSNNLKELFSNVVPALRPLIPSQEIPEPQWLLGFAEGEGHFYIKISIKNQISFRFLVTQHTRDINLLKNIAIYFNCGKAVSRSNKNNISDFIIEKKQEIIKIVIPFFENYTLIGNKLNDYLDFKKAVELDLMCKTAGVNNAEYLSEIKTIKQRMNYSRNSFNENTEDDDSLEAIIDSDSASVSDHPSGEISASRIEGTRKNNKKKGADLCLSNKRQFSSSTVRSKNRVSIGLEVVRSEENKYTPKKISQYAPDAFVSFYTTTRTGWHTGDFLPAARVENLKFLEWLAGLIDGDGQFQTTKKGFSSLQIVMTINDKYTLYEIKHKYGGIIKEISGSKALKYKLFNPKGLIALVNDVNGLLRNPIRMLQLHKVCENYNIRFLDLKPLTYNNGWFSGLIDSDGSIYIDDKLGQVIISVTQKNKLLLEPLQILYGGKIKITKHKEAFQYYIYRKEEILKLIDNYFQINPLKSYKSKKLKLIKEFYLLKDSRNLSIKGSANQKVEIEKYNQWVLYKNKWDKL